MASLQQRDPALQGSSLLHLGLPRLVEHCIIVEKMDPNLLDKDGRTPLDAWISATCFLHRAEPDELRANFTVNLNLVAVSQAGSEEREQDRERWRRPLGPRDSMGMPIPATRASTCVLLVKYGGMLSLTTKDEWVQWVNRHHSIHDRNTFLEHGMPRWMGKPPSNEGLAFEIDDSRIEGQGDARDNDARGKANDGGSTPKNEPLVGRQSFPAQKGAPTSWANEGSKKVVQSKAHGSAGRRTRYWCWC